MTKFHQVSVLNESSIKKGKLIGCKNGLGELANDGAKVSTCKGLAAYEVEHHVIDERSAEVNLIRLISNAPALFDKMPKREHLLCKAMILKCFQEKKLDFTLGLIKKENIWTPLAMLTQSNGSNVVELLDTILNASKSFSTASLDLVGVSPKGLDEGSWVHSFLEEEESDYDMVISTTMEGVRAFEVINAENKNILELIPMAVSYYQKGKVLHYSNKLENSQYAESRLCSGL